MQFRRIMLPKPFINLLKVAFSPEAVLPRILQVIIGFILLATSHFVGSHISSILAKKGEISKDTNNRQKNVNTIYIAAAQIVYWAILTVTLLMIMSLFGVQTASIIAVLSTVGLAVGLAAQGILTNIVTGILLTLFNAYNINDLIEVDGKLLRVKKFNLITTEVEEVPTGVSMIIPNGNMRNSAWINHTREPVKMHMFRVRISNKMKDIESVFAAIREGLAKSPHVLTTVEPVIGVHAMDGAGTVIEVLAPMRSSEYPDATLEIHTRVRDMLAVRNIQLLDGVVSPV
jgi:small conductance mechanosensitive channel